jgi:PAS domain S-box-containing protein
MKKHSESGPDWKAQREKIIGLGESSIHKSYYPELQQRLSELERFKAILSQIYDAIFLISIPSWECVDFNESALNMLGYSRDEFTGKTCFEIIAPEEVARITGNAFESPDDEGYNERFETWFIDSANKKIPVEITRRAVRFSNESYVVIVARDITERRQAEDKLLSKNTELNAAYEELTAIEEELRKNYDELDRSQHALSQATKKLYFLNFITFSDIRNAIFTLSGYLELEREGVTEETMKTYLEKQAVIVSQVENWIQFAKNYQDLGLHLPRWQNVNQSFLYAISHLDFSKISRIINLGGLEIYADQLLEKVFFNLADNVVRHGKTVTAVALRYYETPDGLTIVFDDNGVGIPDDMKEKIFERRLDGRTGMGLFLAREILEITGISIKETGTYGKGARFEISVPKEVYRIISLEE